MGKRSLFAVIGSSIGGLLMGFGLGSQYSKDIALKSIRGVTNNYIISDYPIIALGKEKFSDGLGGRLNNISVEKYKVHFP